MFKSYTQKDKVLKALLTLTLLLPLSACAGTPGQGVAQAEVPEESVKYCGPDPYAEKEGRLSEEAFTREGAKEALETLREIVNGASQHYDTDDWEHAIVRLNGWKLRDDISWERKLKRTSGLYYLIEDFCDLVKEESYLP